MSALVLSPKAKADLSRIWEYTCAEWGVGQAEQYVRCLWEAMEEQTRDLTKSVDMGHVRKGYRKIRSGSHVIFFKVTREGIDVVRILHRKMDFDRKRPGFQRWSPPPF
jgi:toxin ParE1/3/4